MRVRSILLSLLLATSLAAGGLYTGRTITPPAGANGALDVTNVQKLSLSPSTPVGTVVRVSDGFVVSGAGEIELNVFWTKRGQNNGFDYYNPASQPSLDPDEDGTWVVFRAGGIVWSIHGSGGTTLYTSEDDVEFPWLVTTWTQQSGNLPVPTLTHPAVQTFAAPSTEQGGVFVDTIGVLVDAHESNGGKPKYVLLGVGGTDPSVGGGSYWTGSQWNVYDSSGTLINYSTSDVATPDLATNWKNASDDSPASITVTSVSVGEIYAGLFVSNDGATNGSSYVSQPFHGRQYYMGLNGGGSNNMHWDTDFNVWTDDVGVWTTDNVAFPWQGTDSHTGHNGATFIRNNVSNEANWQVVP